MGLTVLLVCKNTACPSFGRKVRYPLTTGRRICDGCSGELHGFMRSDWIAPVEAPQLTRSAPDDAARQMVPAALPPLQAGAMTPELRAEMLRVHGLTPQQFAYEILAAVGARTSIDVREVFAAIKRSVGVAVLRVNRAPANVQSVRQMAARLAREGKLLVSGDTLGAIG